MTCKGVQEIIVRHSSRGGSQAVLEETNKHLRIASGLNDKLAELLEEE